MAPTFLLCPPGARAQAGGTAGGLCERRAMREGGGLVLDTWGGSVWALLSIICKVFPAPSRVSTSVGHLHTERPGEMQTR